MEWETQQQEDGHTPDNPYCGDYSCWCHTDVTYHEQVEYPVYQAGEIAQAYHFFELAPEGGSSYGQ
jgi:hypothetical protein